MTVEQLIKKLQELPPEQQKLEVVVVCFYGDKVTHDISFETEFYYRWGDNGSFYREDSPLAIPGVKVLGLLGYE